MFDTFWGQDVSIIFQGKARMIFCGPRWLEDARGPLTRSDQWDPVPFCCHWPQLRWFKCPLGPAWRTFEARGQESHSIWLWLKLGTLKRSTVSTNAYPLVGVFEAMSERSRSILGGSRAQLDVCWSNRTGFVRWHNRKHASAKLNPKHEEPQHGHRATMLDCLHSDDSRILNPNMLC